MIRKLPLALAISIALAPAGAHALGLGDIHPRSVLNQGFNADIDLLSVKPGELEDVKVKLASPEAFERAGVERPFLLSKLRFKPGRKPDGSAVIHVTSRRPIREPFLNFLVEVNWPKGRLVREYTVLLDPPVTLKRAPVPIMAPETSQPARSASVPATSVAQPSTDYRTRMSSADGAREYGPTQKNDTLWNIAATLKSDDASTEQMIMALWRNNPHAFFGNNVNNLKVGQVLRVPTDEEVRSLGRTEARRQFRGQISAWQEQRGAGSRGARTATAEAPQAKPVTGVAVPESELKLAAAPSPSDTEGKQPELGSATETESLTALKSELLLARETGESARQEAQELRSRIGELEAQVVDVQHLLTLTNNQLARMQAAVGAEQGGLSPEQVADLMRDGTLEVEEAGIAMEGMQTGPDGGGETLTVDEGEAVAQIEVIEGDAAEGDMVAGVPETGQQAAGDLDTVTDTAPAPVAAMPPPQLEQADSSESGGLLDKLMSNAIYLGFGAAALVLLMGLIWFLRSRRRTEEAQFQESILTAEDGVSDTETHELYDTDTAGPASQHSDEVSFLSDFTPSGIDTAHEETGEVDPASEADVYMTYGRYEQAEELVREAMARYPDRQDLKHKLLQIAYATKDVVTFSAVAEELQKVGFGQANPEAWQEIVTMGQELVPQNALFGGLASSAQGGAEAPATLAWSEGADKIADAEGSDIVRAAAAPQPGTEASDDLGGLDFDLGLDVNADSPEAAEAALKELEASASEDLNLDLDLSDLDDLEASLGDSASIGEDVGGEGLSLEDLERSVRQDVGEDDSLTLDALDEAGSLDSLDLESPDLGEEFSLETGESLGGVEQQTATTDDEIPGMTDAGELAGGEPASAGWSDEVTTKLDLARAYVDMGDAEGARSILDEVLVEGDESQKEEANKLREQLI